MIKGFITNREKYNEGVLIGKWIDFPITEEEFWDVLAEIGITEGDQDVFFSDWETEIDLDLSENENFEDVSYLAEQLEEIKQNGELEKLEAIIEATGYDTYKAIDYMDDAVFYPGYDLVEVAEELVNDCYGFRNVDEIFFRYFDYEAFARDLEFDGYTETSQGVIYC